MAVAIGFKLFSFILFQIFNKNDYKFGSISYIIITMSYYIGILLSTIIKLFIKSTTDTTLLPTSITNDTVRCRDYDLDHVNFATIGRPFKANLPEIVFFNNNV